MMQPYCPVLNRMLGLLALVFCASVLGALPAAAQTPAGAPYRIRVVGGLGALNQFTRWEEPFWSHELQRLSGGKFTADIVPFDRAGVPVCRVSK